MCSTCAATVRCVMTSCSAIWRLGSPWPISLATSCSRPVRPAGCSRETPSGSAEVGANASATAASSGIAWPCWSAAAEPASPSALLARRSERSNSKLAPGESATPVVSRRAAAAPTSWRARCGWPWHAARPPSPSSPAATSSRSPTCRAPDLQRRAGLPRRSRCTPAMYGPAQTAHSPAPADGRPQVPGRD
jgi:hypothetical protein